jgi:hypothetical protein
MCPLVSAVEEIRTPVDAVSGGHDPLVHTVVHSVRRSYSSPSTVTASVAPRLTHGSRFEPYTFEEVTSILPKLDTNAVSRSTSGYTPERVATIGTSNRSNIIPSAVATSVYTIQSKQYRQHVPERVILNPGGSLTSIAKISTRDEIRAAVDAVRGQNARSNLVPGGGGVRGGGMLAGDGLW